MGGCHPRIHIHNTTSSNTTMSKWKHQTVLSIAHYQTLSTYKLQMNCLGYRYRYRSKFFNWLLVFLEKAQTTGTNQNFITRCRYFSCCYLFVSLGHCSHMSLSYLSSDDGLIFFCFSFCGALGLLSSLKSKKQKGSDSLPSLMGSYHKSYLHAYLCQNFWVNR